MLRRVLCRDFRFEPCLSPARGPVSSVSIRLKSLIPTGGSRELPAPPRPEIHELNLTSRLRGAESGVPWIFRNLCDPAL